MQEEPLQTPRFGSAHDLAVMSPPSVGICQPAPDAQNIEDAQIRDFRTESSQKSGISVDQCDAVRMSFASSGGVSAFSPAPPILACFNSDSYESEITAEPKSFEGPPELLHALEGFGLADHHAPHGGAGQPDECPITTDAPVREDESGDSASAGGHGSGSSSSTDLIQPNEKKEATPSSSSTSLSPRNIGTLGFPKRVPGTDGHRGGHIHRVSPLPTIPSSEFHRTSSQEDSPLAGQEMPRPDNPGLLSREGGPDAA